MGLNDMKRGERTVTTQHTSGPLIGAGTSVSGRITGKLLATQGYVVGVEISGSGSRQSVALADLEGKILHRVRRPLEHVSNIETVLQLLDEMLADVTNPERLLDGRILRVGVAVGGLVDATHGVVRTVYHGVTCTAGEIGHILVKDNGPKCSCGSFGHLEAIASAQAISRNMIGLAVEYPETLEAVYRVTGDRAERITAEQVFLLAAEGDRTAGYLVGEVLKYLGIALANIVHLVNPGMIILGGPVAQAGDLLIAPLQARIQELCLPAASQSLHVVQGSLGTEANLVGAVTLALQDL